MADAPDVQDVGGRSHGSPAEEASARPRLQAPASPIKSELAVLTTEAIRGAPADREDPLLNLGSETPRLAPGVEGAERSPASLPVAAQEPIRRRPIAATTSRRKRRAHSLLDRRYHLAPRLPRRALPSRTLTSLRHSRPSAELGSSTTRKLARGRTDQIRLTCVWSSQLANRQGSLRRWLVFAKSTR